MIYFTQLIFIKEGKENTFHSFEDHVLPLLQRHNGELIYRVRPPRSSVVATTLGHPYELHLVSFIDRASFEGYRDDPERLQHMHLKDESVERIMLIEGKI
ncbi:DUF1330 domain-containing protein [Dyadobacter pollutisoli]|uniref:DUF1330 domain-containing protein n=1 Tax=Dyadobacter pollutisoli TaxID=2910158 RepID=A0A9E8SPH4_9BACT|nr:DUF1330 domain-containing protein [Dyadobacter pollutisoli]WAC15359.1 DUF1330 domain-containing protein [Dyadobacter pollutisoli]